MKRAGRGRVAPASRLDYQRLFEGAPGLLLVLKPDPGFTILGASDVWLQATRSRRDAIIGRGLFELFPSDNANAGAGELRASLERLLAGSRSEVMPVQKRALQPPDEAGGAPAERYYRPTNSAVLSAAGTVLYLVHHLEDVTDLVRANALERRVEALDAALEEVNRELENLSYSVSHDLRAPLRAIDGFSRILEEDHAERLDSEGRRVLLVIRDSGAKMGRLLEELLAYSRLGRKPMSVAAVDMSGMAREAFQQACADIARIPELRLQPLPPAHGDVSLMQLVWLNLLGNAVKFSGARERAVVEVSAQEQGGETVYSVRDNGVGFDMRYHERLFVLFQKLHPEDEFPGSGVGLAIVQRLVARHGGRVWAEGVPGAGATFHFSLPRAEAHA